MKEIKIAELFYNDYKFTTFKHPHKITILLQNIFYSFFSDEELLELEKKVYEKIKIKTIKPTKLSKIFPENIGKIISLYCQKNQHFSILNFLKDLDIKVSINQEISLF